MSMDGQGTKWLRNIAENFNRLSRAHERYRQTTYGRAIAYSEHEREFTFAKNYRNVCCPSKGLDVVMYDACPVLSRVVMVENSGFIFS